MRDRRPAGGTTHVCVPFRCMPFVYVRRKGCVGADRRSGVCAQPPAAAAWHWAPGCWLTGLRRYGGGATRREIYARRCPPDRHESESAPSHGLALAQWCAPHRNSLASRLISRPRSTVSDPQPAACHCGRAGAAPDLPPRSPRAIQAAPPHCGRLTGVAGGRSGWSAAALPQQPGLRLAQWLLSRP